MIKRKKNNVVLHSKATTNLLKKPSPFICPTRFRNNLPDVPFYPKFLQYPFDNMRYVRYVPTSLEKNYKHILLTEPDLGIPDLIDPDAYATPQSRLPLPPEDEQLIRPELNNTATPVKQVNRPLVTWLRKTEYMTAEYDRLYGGAREVEKQTVGKQTAKDLEESGDSEFNPELLRQAIEDSFEKAKKRPIHPTNPSLKAVQILPVFPDFELWGNSYQHVIFDGDPCPAPPKPSDPQYAHKKEEQEKIMNNAIIKAFEAGEKFVTYLAPKKVETDENGTKKRKLNDDDVMEYQWVREYFYDFKKEHKDRSNYFFVMTDKVVTYNVIGAKVMLQNIKSKREKSKIDQAIRPTRVTVRQREMSREEQALREERRYILKSSTNKYDE